MAQALYDQVRVLLFDPIAANLNLTRGSLFEIGFRTIQATRNFASFSANAFNGECELIIAEATANEGDVVELVRQLRCGEECVNPFLVIILTTWRRTEFAVRHALDSGADGVLIRPFSTASLKERVRGLIQARKEFIVTGDYIGPERRADPARESVLPSFDAPNTLRAVASGSAELLNETIGSIQTVRDGIERERIRRLAMRVATAARLRLERGAEADRFAKDDMDRAARELRRRLKARGHREAVELASALTGVTASLMEPDAEDVRRSLALAHDLAFGAYASFAGESERGRSREGVERIVAAVRARLRAEVLPQAS